MTPSAPAPMAAPEMNWTGFYAGLFGGYHTGKVKVEGCVGICPSDPKLDGGLFGLQVGYDYEFPNHVVTGVFGWVPVVRPKSTIVSTGFGFTFRDQLKERFTGVVGARVGYAYDKWLPYAFAGVEYTNWQINLSGGGGSFSNDYVGVAAGVGAEYAVTRHISLDLRYMYSHLPSKTFNFGGGPEKYSEPNGSTFLAAINYRF